MTPDDTPHTLRINEASIKTGLNRTMLYRLMNDGKIRYSEIRERYASRGVRLIHWESLKDYISSCTVDPSSDSEVQNRQ